MKIKYDSNNSGGRWWLKDEHWKALEAAGWEVDMISHSAMKEFPSVADAIVEWESITGMDSDAPGCKCCGRPHYFDEA